MNKDLRSDIRAQIFQKPLFILTVYNSELYGNSSIRTVNNLVTVIKCHARVFEFEQLKLVSAIITLVVTENLFNNVLFKINYLTIS